MLSMCDDQALASALFAMLAALATDPVQGVRSTEAT